MSEEDAFDLFSTSVVKVKSKKSEEKRRADEIQFASAMRMGDVPPEQLPEVAGRVTWDFLYSRLYDLVWSTYFVRPAKSFEIEWVTYLFPPEPKRESITWRMNWRGLAQPWGATDIELVPTPHYAAKTALFVAPPSVLDLPRFYVPLPDFAPQTQRTKSWMKNKSRPF